MFLEKGVLKSFPNFIWKQLCWCLFLKSLQAEGLQFYFKSLQHRCFPVTFTKFLRTHLFTEHLQWLLLHFRWLLLYFFKNVIKTNFIWEHLIVFNLICIKLRSSLIYNTSARHERNEYNTSTTLATRVWHEQHESDMNTTQVWHACSTSATRTTQVRHECYTNNTSATRVLHEQHECDTNEKFWFW